MLTAANPVFVAYVVTALVLLANLVFVWNWSGVARGRTKSAVNAEDAAAFKSHKVDADPETVARVLRAHANAEASIYPFLFVGFLFVCLGGGFSTACVLFGVFTVARLGHSTSYLNGVQPWRTIAFLVGLVAFVALAGDVVYLLVRGHAFG